jgi:hypothetical protein
MMRKQNMNMTYSNFNLILVLALSLLMSACGMEQEDVVEEPTPVSTSSIAPDDYEYNEDSSDRMITWSAINISTADSGWANHEIPGEPIKDATFVGCNGCEPYRGDVDKTADLRLLCFVPSDISEPSSYADTQQARWNARDEYPAIDDWRYYYNWSGGYVGLTRPVYTLEEAGIITSIPLESASAGDRACQIELDDDQAKLMEFHDSGGAWNLAGMIHPNSVAPELLSSRAGEERFIIWIKDQQSNPWN